MCKVIGEPGGFRKARSLKEATHPGNVKPHVTCFRFVGSAHPNLDPMFSEKPQRAFLR